MYRVALALSAASPSAADVSRQPSTNSGSPFTPPPPPQHISGKLADSLFAPINPASLEQRRSVPPPVPQQSRQERQRRINSMRQSVGRHAGVVNSIKNGAYSSNLQTANGDNAPTASNLLDQMVQDTAPPAPQQPSASTVVEHAPSVSANNLHQRKPFQLGKFVPRKLQKQIQTIRAAAKPKPARAEIRREHEKEKEEYFETVRKDLAEQQQRIDERKQREQVLIYLICCVTVKITNWNQRSKN